MFNLNKYCFFLEKLKYEIRGDKCSSKYFSLYTIELKTKIVIIFCFNVKGEGEVSNIICLLCVLIDIHSRLNESLHDVLEIEKDKNKFNISCTKGIIYSFQAL